MLKDGAQDLGARFNVSPLKNIREARERLDYFAAFTLSVAYIEYYAFVKQRKGLDKKAIKALKKKNVWPSVRKLIHEDKDIQVLLKKDEDRKKLLENIRKVIKERNDLVHPDTIYNKYDFDERREELLDLAIESITHLMNII